MFKRLAVLTTSLTVLIFIIGCPQVTSESVKPPKAEPKEVTTPKAEPAKTKLPEPQPPKVEPLKAEPTKAEPNTFEPPIAELPKPELPKIEPPKAESPETEPPELETTKVEPPETELISVVSFHDKCAGILTNFVDDKGMVDYKTLKRKKIELKWLLNEFENLDPNEYNSWHKADKIAFWINAYNIQMLKIIIDNYPIKASRIRSIFWGPNSIRHIRGIWDKYKFIVMNEEFTLSEIERRFFCEEFDEPRAFFAASLASLSSPPLRNEPYYGHKLYEQLNDQTRKSLSGPYAFRIDRDRKRVYLSAILQPTWQGENFIHKYGTDKKFKNNPPVVRAVLNFAINYITRQDVLFLERENYTVEYMNYNWTLNEK